MALRHHHRFIYASSAATYGDGSQGFKDADDKLPHLYPLNMYGYSKHLFDLWLKHEGLLSRTVGLKYFNVFGPNENHKGRMASAIYHMMPQIKKEGKIKLFRSSEPHKFKDGEQQRDFIWVDDVARMTTAFLNNSAGGIFNIATGSPTTWNELAGALFKLLDKEPQIDYISMPDDLVGKYQNYTCADMEKTRKVLGGGSQNYTHRKCRSNLCERLPSAGKTMVKLIGFLSLIAPKKILVVGDLMLDSYTIGKASRISPEAPVAVLHVREERSLPGGAGNVALNLRSLGQEVAVLGRCGTDAAGSVLKCALEDEGIEVGGIIFDETFQTPIKNRIIADNQQMLRIDREVTFPLLPEKEAEILTRLPALLENVSAIAISDYGKGFLQRVRF